MKYRRRIYYSAEQRAEIWDRWQRGESMSSIGRVFDRQSSSVFSVISPTGGIRPPDRRRCRSALSLSEREEISRGLSCKQSVRAIARRLGRGPIDDQPGGTTQWRIGWLSCLWVRPSRSGPGVAPEDLQACLSPKIGPRSISKATAQMVT